MWDGFLGLKNEQALVKMHFVSGSVEVARGALPEGSTSHIRISQRMRLEHSQLEGVARKMQVLWWWHSLLCLFKCRIFVIAFIKRF